MFVSYRSPKSDVKPFYISYPKKRCCVSYNFNTLRPRQNGRHFPDDIFKCIFLNKDMRISYKISLKLASKGPIYNMLALFQIMAWRRPGDKPLSEPMMLRLPTHICVIRPQWVKPCTWQPLAVFLKLHNVFLSLILIYHSSIYNQTTFSLKYYTCSIRDSSTYMIIRRIVKTNHR